MDTVLLREFIDPAPLCADTASLDAVLDCFRQKPYEHMVVVDSQQHPIGLLPFRKLISYWLNAAIEQGDNRLTIAQLTSKIDPLLLEPLVLLPLHTNLRHLQPHLAEFQERQYGLVDQMGRFWGLLDRLKLLQFLVTHRASTVISTPLPLPLPQIVVDIASSAPANAEILLRSTALSHLIDLLDRLPLPLMLQTSTGEVVTQNLSWRQQVGELLDPIEIRQEAAVLLGASAGNSTPAVAPTLPALNLLQSANYCQIGSDDHSCICVCPMKDGRERVLKFIKIPLAASLALGAEPVGSTYISIAEALNQPLRQFQLAALELKASIWKRRIQTIASLWQQGGLWLILAEDTTEQHQIEKELTAKNANLTQLNQLKDEFLASISHELKTPLTAILGLSSLLKDQSLGLLNDRQVRYAQLIHHSGRQLILIVNNILDLTRIETGQLELTPGLVDLKNVCTSAYEQAWQSQTAASQVLLPTSTKAELTFHLAIEPALETIVADPLRLRQMLGNLLSNAIKFTATGGKIGLKVENWQGWIALTVWDTGIGIAIDKQHLMFQKFQQLENPLTRKFEGTGLGLVLTQRLARLHGGDITFTSVEGQGSQFTLLLPPTPPIAQAHCLATVKSTAKPTAKPTASFKGASLSDNRLILVVEAGARFVDDLTDQLSGLGYRVVIARSGTEALEKARCLQPGAIFLNPILPLLSGWDLLTLLKSDAETRHIPVIVTADRSEHRVPQNQADDFVVLPVQRSTLQQTLDRLLTPVPHRDPIEQLTVLHLWASDRASDRATDPQRSIPVDLHRLLHPRQCRILEVDDLDQADLLARVWKPNVILLDGVLAEPTTYLKELSQRAFLSALPLVTLTAEMTQAANGMPGLAVFPCLAASAPSLAEPSALLQVLQVAVGIGWAPQILMVDLSMLTVAIPEEATSSTKPSARPNLLPPCKTSEQLRAVTHYLEAAGFHSRVSTAWTEVFHQLQHQSVDLLLLWMRQEGQQPAIQRALQTLAQLEPKPPILVLQVELLPDQGITEVDALLASIATRVLPASLPLPQLLEQINQLMSRTS